MLLVVIALETFDAGGGAVGALNAMLGIGGLIGAALVIRHVAPQRLAAAFRIGIGMWGLGVAALALARRSRSPAS